MPRLQFVMSESVWLKQSCWMRSTSCLFPAVENNCFLTALGSLSRDAPSDGVIAAALGDDPNEQARSRQCWSWGVEGPGAPEGLGMFGAAAPAPPGAVLPMHVPPKDAETAEGIHVELRF